MAEEHGVGFGFVLEIFQRRGCVLSAHRGFRIRCGLTVAKLPVDGKSGAELNMGAERLYVLLS
jgi:hypothetical protein